jgi:chromosome segregation ATPase
MNATIYPTILTGLGIVITLIVTMHNLAKTTQQETNRRIDDLKNDLKELLEAKFKVVDSRFDVVDVRFQKLEGDLADVRQDVQDIRQEVREIKRVIFNPAV